MLQWEILLREFLQTQDIGIFRRILFPGSFLDKSRTDLGSREEKSQHPVVAWPAIVVEAPCETYSRKLVVYHSEKRSQYSTKLI